jgi:hypothetical protein
VIQLPVDPRPEQVVKEGEATSLPIVAIVGADGACRYVVDRHCSIATWESASVAPASTQTVWEHPVRINNAGAKSQPTLMVLGCLVFIGKFLSGAIQQPV